MIRGARNGDLMASRDGVHVVKGRERWRDGLSGPVYVQVLTYCGKRWSPKDGIRVPPRSKQSVTCTACRAERQKEAP